MTGIREQLRTMAAANQPFSIEVQVEAVQRISSSFRRVTVSGPGLAQYANPSPADAFKLLLPPDGHGRVDFPQRGDNGLPLWAEDARRPALRAFTVRSFDTITHRLDFDVADHDGGIAMDWLAATTPGATIGLAGMRREFAVGTGIEAFLFLADATGLPAVAAIIETLDSTTPIDVYLTVPHESDHALLPKRDGVTAHWVPDLISAVEHLPAPTRRTQVWLAAEAAVVRTIRRRVLDEWQLHRADLHAAAYWKAGHDSTQLDSINLVRYQQAVSEGYDVVDPDVRERIELTP
ncbi:siderophore-interacting protein [Nocardia sp. NPDC050175]|uniref:siderophore-interacting protein n=1 Tax=Nocardia sp. NPDC050175 TaxID=3364317 RepID=UPI00379459C3